MLTQNEKNNLLQELYQLEQKAHLIRMMLGMYEQEELPLQVDSFPDLPSAKYMDRTDLTKERALPPGISLRKDGRYVGRFMHKGKSYSFYGKDPQRLKQQLEHYKLIICSGCYTNTSELLLSDWFEIWLKQFKSNHIKKTSQRVYRSTYYTHIHPVLGSHNISDISLFMLQKLLNDLADQISYSTLSRVYLILHLLFNSAYKNEIIKINPIKSVLIPSVNRTRKEQRVLSQHEQKIFDQYAKADAFYPAFQIALSTGLRNGEIRALEWSEIDMERQMIHVRGTISYINKQYVKTAPKSHSSYRDVPMTNKVLRLLKDLQKHSGGSTFVFCNPDQSCLSQNILMHHIRMIEKAIRKDYPEWDAIHFHTLRHTFATRAIEGGMTPQTLKAILGHSTISMTMDLYSHVLPNTKASQMKQIEKLL